MTETILVAAAWPYANAEIHVGNLTGSYLPADIFARYNRLRGRKVLMVSGSDAHGTPITVRADAENTTRLRSIKRFHEGFLETFQQLGLTYDLFTSTHTTNHFKVSQDIFLALKHNGYLYTDRTVPVVCALTEPFPARPLRRRHLLHLRLPNARSDQCDKCGSVLEPQKLIDPRSRIDGSTPELRETEHFYLDLGKLQDEVVAFLRERDPTGGPMYCANRWANRSGRAARRPITRDLDWGIPVPDRRLDRQMPVRMVRGSHRLPIRLD